MQTTSKMMTPEELDTLKDNYAYHIVDGMDMNDLITFAVEAIAHNMESWDEEEVKEEREGQGCSGGTCSGGGDRGGRG